MSAQLPCNRTIRPVFVGGLSLLLAAATPPASVTLRPGDDIQAALYSHPEGTTFVLTAGVYRLAGTGLIARNKDVFIGRRGAVLNGSKLVTNFAREEFAKGPVWRADGQTQKNPLVRGQCYPGSYQGCRYSESVFYDDHMLWRVMSLAELGAGKFYFDYAKQRIYIADDPSGHKVEAAVATRALDGDGVEGVTVRGLVIEKFANEAGFGALQAGETWIIENNEVRLNHGAGIANGAVVRGNYVHHNGQEGIASDSTKGTLVENNEIGFNNIAGFNGAWEAGGTKFWMTTDLIVRGNYVHDNNGPGLWADTDNIRTLYENNRVINNTREGILHEISYDAIVRKNFVQGNGYGPQPLWWGDGCGIEVYSSPNVEISGNTVVNNYNGIGLVDVERGSGAHGVYEVRNVHVHSNTITMSRGYTGLIARNEEYFRSKNNRFFDNSYCLDHTAGKFYQWMGRWCTRTEWTRFGQDAHGSWSCAALPIIKSPG